MQENNFPTEDKPYSIIDHLEELRQRLIRSLIVLAVLFFPAYSISLPVIEWMKRTLCPNLKNLVYIYPMEIFFTRIKVAFFLAILAAFPYISYQIWKFISPALFKKEKYYISRFVFLSSGLFLFGAIFALFFICPAVIDFTLSMSSPDIVPMVDVQSFINLTAMMMLGFGITFQLPILVFILSRTGIVGTKTMKEMRPYIIVGIFIVSAILTPPDIISQLAMAIPTLLLFEISLFFSGYSEKKRNKSNETPDAG